MRTTEEKNLFTAIAQKHKTYPAATAIRPRTWQAQSQGRARAAGTQALVQETGIER